MITLGIHDPAFLADAARIHCLDNMEGYAESASLSGLHGGLGWTGPYVLYSDYIGPAFDDMESYTSGSSLNSLNGGTLWNNAWTSRS